MKNPTTMMITAKTAMEMPTKSEELAGSTTSLPVDFPIWDLAGRASSLFTEIRVLTP